MRWRFRPPPQRRLLAVGLGMTVLLAIAGWFAPAAVLHGWLIAFASLGGISIGCVAWLAIYGLTGGRWGELGRPALLAGAMGLPVVVGLVMPLLLADHFIYAWAAEPDTAGPGVASAYLNTGFMALRSLGLLGGLCAFAFLERRAALAGRPSPGQLACALCLLLYAAGMNLSAFDWLLSLDPRFTSSAFGMQVIVAQLMSALCLVILLTRTPADHKVWGDFAALLFATVLGEAYLILMSLIVQWYGDLPDKADWYLRRSHGGWQAVEWLATLVGAVGPMLALLFGRVRHNPALLKSVAGLVLVGAVLENIWLVAPEAAFLSQGAAGAWAVVAGCAALVAGGCLMAAAGLGRAGQPFAETLAGKRPEGTSDGA